MLTKEITPLRIGTIGYLTVFLWSLGLMMLVPQEVVLIAAATCFLVDMLIFQLSLRPLFQLRWLLILSLLALPPVFLLGELDRSFLSLSYSSEGLAAGFQIALRFIIVMIALSGFTQKVDITSIAGLLERSGLPGLGFSMGIALNLLPSLHRSAVNAWHSLWMRGGLRIQRWRGLQLLAFTVLTNALRRSEEIALAAEARAYSPDRSRPMPIIHGEWDWLVVFLALASLVVILILR